MRIYNFIFSDKIVTRILRHVCFWLAWYMYQVMLFLYYNSNVQNTFWLTLKVRCLKLLFVMPFGIIQCYIVVYWLIPKYLLKKKYFLFIASIIVSSVAVILPVDLVTVNRYDFLTVWMQIVSYVTRAGPVLCCIFIMLKMLKTWYIREQEKDTLLKENLSAELQLLKAQVHPHFLFNTLNNIYSFILSNPPKARSLVKKLEKILKYMILECDAPLVYLNKEISMIRDYIELEKVRYGNSLDIKIEITGDTSRKSITPLLMIPFIENSFKHGASKMLRKPWVQLAIQADETILHFAVTNGKPAEENEKSKGGIGLSNVKKRLELLYPQDHLLLIESTENTFTVNMRIPLKNKEVVV